MQAARRTEDVAAHADGGAGARHDRQQLPRLQPDLVVDVADPGAAAHGDGALVPRHPHAVHFGQVHRQHAVALRVALHRGRLDAQRPVSSRGQQLRQGPLQRRPSQAPPSQHKTPPTTHHERVAAAAGHDADAEGAGAAHGAGDGRVRPRIDDSQRERAVQAVPALGSGRVCGGLRGVDDHSQAAHASEAAPQGVRLPPLVVVVVAAGPGAAGGCAWGGWGVDL